jgi:2-keto-3-deoxy-L-rhamnonate aldolase RhmA
MRSNVAKERLRAGKVSCGPSISYGSPDLAEQVAHLGFDWVWIDWQHGQWTETTLNEALARFLPTSSAPLVRVKGHEPGTINRVLDMGAMGVIVPMVQNVEHARLAVQAAYYPPMGMRSGGGMRLGLLAGGTAADYAATANDRIMVVVMVETEEAIANVPGIMEVPGIDVVLIGPWDLMLDVRARGHDAARHEELVQQVAAASKVSGVAAGYVCGSVEDAQRRIAEGFRFLTLGGDHGILMAGFGNLRARTRDW